MIYPIINREDNNLSSTKTGQVLVKFNPKTDFKTIENYHKKINATVVEQNHLLGFQIVSSNYPINYMLDYYNKLGNIEYVKPDCNISIC